MYDFNVTKYIRLKIFKATIQPRFEAFLNALLTGIKTLHSAFLIYKAGVEEELQITSNKRILQYWLNEKFDPENRLIEIKQYMEGQTFFVFLENENRPLYLPQFLGGTAFDFIIEVPSSLQSMNAKIKAFVDTYKLPTKRYQIVYV